MGETSETTQWNSHWSSTSAEQYDGQASIERYQPKVLPDENWESLTDPVERRRVQNRIAQRGYRHRKYNLRTHIAIPGLTIWQVYERARNCLSSKQQKKEVLRRVAVPTELLTPTHPTAKVAAGQFPGQTLGSTLRDMSNKARLASSNNNNYNIILLPPVSMVRRILAITCAFLQSQMIILAI